MSHYDVAIANAKYFCELTLFSNRKELRHLKTDLIDWLIILLKMEMSTMCKKRLLKQSVLANL